MDIISNKILKQLRIDKELNQREIAEILSIPTNTYNHYELSNRQVPDDIKIKLAEFYDVSLDYLITGKERDYMYQLPKKTEIEEIYSKLTPEEQKQAKTFMLGMLSARDDKDTQEYVRSKIG